jgi:hypothetical protein
MAKSAHSASNPPIDVAHVKSFARVSSRTDPRPGAVFKRLRILFLLLVLLMVSLVTWQDRYRSTRWREPLFVAVYPIAADDSPVTRAYLEALDAEGFESIDEFFMREARRYHLRIEEPVKTRLRSELKERPPRRTDGGILATAFWSLRLRYWAWRVSGNAREPEDIRMFVLFHDSTLTPVVPHSLGLTKGLIGVVYAFASPAMSGANDVVIAHELLHTLGASDKYNPVTDAPRFPDGYGDPQQIPMYPQLTAEVMAGRRMLSATHWEQAQSLDETVIGPSTALEIRWPQHAE